MCLPSLASHEYNVLKSAPMTRRQWATDEQLAWLRARNDDYLKARQNSALTQWWPQTYQGWFDQWPMPEPSAEEIASAKGDKEAAIATMKDKKKDVSMNIGTKNST